MKKLIYIITMLTGFCAYAQDTPNPANDKLREITVSLDSFMNKIPVEKVHVHFDKPYYNLGDTLWMKAYVVTPDNQLSTQSKILYADLTDDKDSIKISMCMPLTAGVAWGSLVLSDSLLQKGNYRIRVYTTMMRNFDAAYFFNKDIAVGDGSVQFAATASGTKPLAPAPLSFLSDSIAVSIQFFPEGGELVEGIDSKIGFKAVGIDGLSREISGYIINQDNKQLTTFQTERAGIGSFMLQPVSGSTYTAVIQFKDKSQKRMPLPQPLKQGYSLSVAQNEANVVVKINASNGLLNSGQVMLVAQAANAVQYTGAKQLSKSTLTVVLPKSRFPEGMVQFTLFSADKKPVAERLIFVRRSNQHLNVQISSDKADYKTRGKVHLNLQVTDHQGNPAVGVFSLAVTDEGKVPYNEVNEKTIFSSLLLSADLRGYIEQPNYYFTDTTAAKARQLDNLMLTQGWRRFTWDKVLANELPTLSFRPENGIGISGKVVNNKGKPEPGAKVNLLAGMGAGLLLDTVTDAQGRFSFDDLALPKGVKYNIAATNAKGKKNVVVEVDKDKNLQAPPVEHMLIEVPLPEEVIALQHANNKLPDSLRNAGSFVNRVNTLKEVVITDKKKTALEVALQFRDPFLRPADRVFTFVDLANAVSLPHYLINRVGLIHIVPNPMMPNDFTASRRGARIPITLNGHKPIPGELGAISTQQIAAIEITDTEIAITLKRDGVDYDTYIREAEKEKQQATAKAIELKEVEIKAKKESEVKKIALQNSRSRYGTADQVLTFVDLADCGDLRLCLGTKLTNVRIVYDPKKMNVFRLIHEGQQMPVFVNGREFKPDELTTINADQIAGIEVFKGARNGVEITLKRGGVDYNKYIQEHEEEKLKKIAMKEVVITDKKKLENIRTIATKNSASLAGPGSADQVLTFMDFLGCQYSLDQCLQGRVVNGVVSKTNGKLYVRNFDLPVLVVVDGVEGRDLSSVMSSDVSSVEILRGGGAASLYGMKGANGVIIVTTKRGDINYDSYTPGYHRMVSSKPAFVNYKFQTGYDLRRQFYSPDYDNPATNKQLADERSTIYWAPNIITDENGKASVDFFNADGKGSYRVITEGLSLEGKLGRQVYKYVVK